MDGTSRNRSTSSEGGSQCPGCKLNASVSNDRTAALRLGFKGEVLRTMGEGSHMLLLLLNLDHCASFNDHYRIRLMMIARAPPSP